jgi:hypothetical protein
MELKKKNLLRMIEKDKNLNFNEEYIGDTLMSLNLKTQANIKQKMKS